MDLYSPVKDLTKDELNKQIVLMRKVIKRAKVHVISNLVQKCRKLQSSSTKQSPKLKSSEKADRILMEINEIKHLKADEISKFVLMNEATFNQIAKEGTIKVRALARLSEQKFIKKEICEFRKKYPKWAVQVQSLYHIWAIQASALKKKQQNKEIGDIYVQPTTTHKVKSKIVNSNEQVKVSSQKQNNGPKTNNTLPKVCAATKDDDNEKLSLEEINKTIKTKHSKEIIQKSAGAVILKVINLEGADDEIVSEKKTKTQIKKFVSTLNSAIKKPQSSFFCDMDDQELLDREPEKKEIEKPPKSPGNKPLKRKNDPDNGYPNKISRNAPRDSQHNKHNSKELAVKSDVALHPSWQAKRNQSQHIFQDIQAKKIVFDD